MSKDTMYAVLDVETTGGSPKNSKITEIAIVHTDGKNIYKKYQTFINPERRIDPFVVKLTGITDAMVEGAPKFFEVAKTILEHIEGFVVVAHNSSFDYGMLKREFQTLGYYLRLDTLCTVELSKAAFPDLPSYSLGKLAKSLGVGLDSHHRAIDDTLATTEIFHQAVETLPEFEITKRLKKTLSLKELHPEMHPNTIEELPNKTGVYLFKNKEGEIIYIGKANKIKTRIQQHYRNKEDKARRMCQETVEIDYILTGSELGALLEENFLIRKHLPQYNTAQKVSSFSHGIYSYTDQQGVIHLYTEKLSAKNQTKPLSVFKSLATAKKFLEGMAEEHGLCKKYLHLEEYREENRGCFGSQLGTCIGVCSDKTKVEEYNVRVQEALSTLTFFDEGQILLIEKGGRSREKLIVLLEDGIYVGHAFIAFFSNQKIKSYLKKLKKPEPTTYLQRTIIHQIHKKPIEALKLNYEQP